MASLKTMMDSPLMLEEREPPLAKVTQEGLQSLRTGLQHAAHELKSAWWSLNEENGMDEFMFPGWRIKTPWHFIFLWFFTFLVALYFEGSKLFLSKLQLDGNKAKYRKCKPCIYNRVFLKVSFTMTSVLHTFIGYMLMMAVMAYLQLLLAVALGMMLGYFLFGILQFRINLQCYCGCIPQCTRECDDAGGDRCNRKLCDPRVCQRELYRKMKQAGCDHKSNHRNCSHQLHRVDEIELRQTDLQTDLFHYEGDRNKSLELYPCSHESLPKILMKQEKLPIVVVQKAESVPRLPSKLDQYQLHPEHYYTCDQGHLHHYPEFCPHLMENKIQCQSMTLTKIDFNT